MLRVRGDVYKKVEGEDILVKQIGIRANDEEQLSSIKAKKEAEITPGKHIVWTEI